MAGTYITISGQTWDQIAYEVYGEERYCTYLMENNRDKLEYVVFPDGITLLIQDKESLANISRSSDYPAWRAGLDG